MHIAVLLKLIPHPDSLRLDQASRRLVRSGVPLINPCDEAALEAAVRIKEEHGGEVLAFSMTPLDAPALLASALACGADRICVIQDDAFSNADVSVTAAVLRRALERYVPQLDLIIAGDRSADGQTGQLGPMLAELLSMPHVSAVRRVRRCDPKAISVERKVPGGYEIVECALPAVMTVLQQVATPRYPTVASRRAAWRRCRRDLFIVSAAQLELAGQSLPTPKTRVARVGRPKARGYQKLDENLSAADRMQMLIGGGKPPGAAGEGEGGTAKVIIRNQPPERAAESLLDAMIKRGIDVR